jgi:hypothetical protein
MAKPAPNTPESPGQPRREGFDRGEPPVPDTVVATRTSGGALDEARRRFKELATASVERCDLTPDMGRAVLHSLELGFAQIIKEGGPGMQRQFGPNVEAAVGWAAENLIEASRCLAGDRPGQGRSPLQNLARLEVRALEMMLPALAPSTEERAGGGSVPTAQLKSFCALLNDGLDLIHLADAAADRRDQHAYQGHYVLSRNKLRNAARTLRDMLRGARSDARELAAGLHGFQLELAAHTGSLRMFLKALCARKADRRLPQRRADELDPHCLTEDLLPILLDRHFAFTIRTPHGMTAGQARDLITAAHTLMWQKVATPISIALDDPERLTPTEFKNLVEAELRKAIEEVNQQFAAERVTIRISSHSAHEIRRREW